MIKKPLNPVGKWEKKLAESINKKAPNLDGKLKRKINDLRQNINKRLSMKNFPTRWVTKKENWRLMTEAQDQKIEVFWWVNAKLCDIQAKSSGA